MIPETEKPEEEEAQSVKIINQGSYGCVFHPGINPNGEVDNNKNYVNKIESSKTVSNNEWEISKKIIEIPDYSFFFSPILDSNRITLSAVNINEDEIQKCEIIRNNPNQTYLSNKIKYIEHGVHMNNYFFDILKTKPVMLIENMLKIHLYLLESLRILSNKSIVHYDLKENNILVDKTKKIPIIIDFGISIDMSKLSQNNYKYAFYSYTHSYPYWCFDITLLSYIFHKIGDVWEHTNVSEEDIGRITQTHIEKSDFFLYVFTQEEKEQWRTNHMNYYKQFIGKTWKDIVNDTLKYYKTWDNYSLSVMYLYFIYENVLQKKFNPKYIELLKTIVTEIPPNRLTCEKTTESIHQIY